jgi:hypothetical protein
MSHGRNQPPPGYRVIFRWSRVNPKTGLRERPRNGRPFPILVPIEDDRPKD